MRNWFTKSFISNYIISKKGYLKTEHLINKSEEKWLTL